MGNAVVFTRAFNECGLGGRFSKYQLMQSGEWFKLLNVAVMEDTRFCFKTYDRINHKAFQMVDACEAYGLHSDDPQWKSHLDAAVRAINKIISKSNNQGPTRFYIDDVQKSVFIINRMFVIEITPSHRIVPDLPSEAVFNWLDVNASGYSKDSEVRVLSHMGRVWIYVGNAEYFTLLTPEEIIHLYGG